MKKEEQNPVFEVWLAAFQNRLIEVARVCAPPDQASMKADETATPQPNPPHPAKNS
jgi:hypothetical protein